MEYIQNKKLYSDGILIAHMAEATTKSIKKIALQKEIGSFSTFCIKEGKKRDLKNILESEEIKNILEAKDIVYDMRYWKRKYLIFNFFVGSVDHECSHIASNFIDF
ncbi:hypothetical protein EAI30_16590 [Romboutsia ilealis]|uniref:Uncharacterized protein n=1 Tax=Romboutsia faecis TaxID=2764597 RepID=A0ABR7JTZ4_9FIRM|nr:hypothetical protein [Romboutsia faecis]MBC5998387.1 hypothetical protein [Romboutsia faecis]MRN26233.1 hypothetical protein [Romboutsia ilealis]